MSFNHPVLVIATGNAGKLREIRVMLSGFLGEIRTLHDHFDVLPEIAEDGDTFFENACIKANWVYKKLGLWALADDSGLSVDALGGSPGVMSARFAGEPVNIAANNEKLLTLLHGVPFDKRTARFTSATVLRIDEKTLLQAQGYCEGHITTEPKGNGGFGYDPLFVPDGYNVTFAQLCDEEKNRISHRGKALEGLKEKLYAFLQI